MNSKRNALPAIRNKNAAKRRYYGEKIETGISLITFFQQSPLHELNKYGPCAVRTSGFL